MDENEYTVSEHGTITNPGKFEGQPAWVPKAWEMALLGTWEQEGSVDTGMHYCYTEADQELIDELGLDPDTHCVVIMTDDQGFVYGETHNAEDYERFLFQLKQMIENTYEAGLMLKFADEPDWLALAYENAKEAGWPKIGKHVEDGQVWYHTELTEALAQAFLRVDPEEFEDEGKMVVVRVSDEGSVEGAILTREQYGTFLEDPEEMADEILPDPY